MIIVSLGPLVSHFQPKFKDVLLGNRYKIIFQFFSEFLQKLKQQGVKLIFPIAIDNEIKGRTKKFHGYRDGVEFIDQIEKDNNLEALCEFFRKGLTDEFKAPHDPVFWDLLQEAAADYGEIIMFCVPEHHTTVFYRMLAKDLNAFAVMAFESNYIVAEGSWKYWASNELDIKTMTIVEFDKQAVLDHLGLNFQHIPLFQAMSGVLMSAEDFKIVREIFSFKQTFFITNLARYIGRCNFTSPPTFTDLQEIKRFVIRNCRIGQSLSVHFVGDLQKALRYITIPVSLKILKISIEISALFFIFRKTWKIAAKTSKTTSHTAKDLVSIF